MTLNGKQHHLYSLLTSVLPATATVMLVVAGDMHRPFSVLGVLSLGVAFTLFLTMATLVVYIRNKAIPSESKERIFSYNLCGILSMLVVLTVTTGIGLVLDPTGAVFLSLVPAIVTAVATIRFLALPPEVQTKPADQ